jgi:hypothetical protein
MVRYIHTVILALLLPFAAVGQGKTFNVEGHIMSSGFDFEEPEGEPFIKVSLKDSSLKVIDSDETGFDGKYRFENIPEGTLIELQNSTASVTVDPSSLVN